MKPNPVDSGSPRLSGSTLRDSRPRDAAQQACDWEQRLVALGDDEVVPLQLQLGPERLEVWMDRDGLHFRQSDANSPVGYLSWERAIAMSLVPEEWRPLLSSA